MTTRKASNVKRGEKKALDDIKEHGCHVIHVLAEGGQPAFTYSVGIQRSSRAPEVIVIGLERERAEFIVNEYNTRVRAGEVFAAGESYAGFVEGFDVTFAMVDRSHHEGRLGWDRWLYGGDEFEALQVVYPMADGTWPWDAGASDAFRAGQPLLTTDDSLDDPESGEP